MDVFRVVFVGHQAFHLQRFSSCQEGVEIRCGNTELPKIGKVEASVKVRKLDAHQADERVWVGILLEDPVEEGRSD